MLSSRKILLAGASVLALSVGYVSPAASCTTFSGSTTITGSLSNCVNFTGSNFSIQSAASLSSASGSALTISSGSATGVQNDGRISGGATGVDNIGTIGTITNSGSISAVRRGIDNEQTITSLINSSSATIVTSSDRGQAIANNGHIGSIVNAGTLLVTGTVTNTDGPSGSALAANPIGITNYVSITSVSNSGFISVSGVSSTGIMNASGSIGTVTNSGRIVISGNSGAGVTNYATLTSLTNSGTISDSGSAAHGIYNTGSMVTLGNSGTIKADGAAAVGLYDNGSIGVLTNDGVITASGAGAIGIKNRGSGTISSLANNGMLSGQGYALSNTGSIGAITNSGVIAGDILNSSANNLTINGAGGAGYGLLTGYNGGSASASSPGTIGTITSTTADLLIASGNIWLNDNIDATGHAVGVTNANVKVSNSLTITGTYSQTGGGLALVNGASISISGASAATVTNTSITISGSGLTAGTYTIVNANAVGTYTHDTLTISGSSGLTGSLSTADGGNDLVVTLATSSYTGKGQSSGGAAAGMGMALDAIANSNTPQAVAFQNTVLSTLAALPLSAQLMAIKQLAPTQITPASQAATQSAAPTTSVIEQHELALLDGGNAGAAAGSAGHAFGLWGQMLGGTALRDSTANASGYRSKNFGLVSGLDYQPDPDTTLGVALSWVKGWSWGADTATGSYTTTNSYQITGYGLHRWGPVFLDGQLGFGYNTYDQTRAIGFLDQKAKASYGGEQYLVKSGIGYDFALGDGVTATPLAGLRFLRAVSDGYQESGSDANLTVDRRGVQSLTQDLGGKVSWKLDSDWGLLTPEVRLAWVHDYTKGPIASSGFMGGQAFTSMVARPSADGAKLNLAVTLDTTDDVSFRAEYEGELRPDYQSHSGLIKVTWGF